MSVHPLAGKPLPAELQVDVAELLAAYYDDAPDPSDPAQQVAFGTSGHRGSSVRRSFNDAHIAAVSQAIADYRGSAGVTGPLFLGRDTHPLSEPALATALEVFAANDIEVVLDGGAPYTPTPVISHAVLRYNHDRSFAIGDGVVITPSHNPPEDGGFKYNPPSGGPADTDVTSVIERRANDLLADRLRAVKRVPTEQAQRIFAGRTRDMTSAYVADLSSVIDIDAVAASGVRIGVDPLGGASLACWEQIADRYGLAIEIVNRRIDPAFSFMTLDWDGRIRMDCSSPHAMRRLIGLQDRYDVAWACDTDHDRHGIVARSTGLLNPNHYLAVAISYLFSYRPNWRPDAAVGKTVVSSSMIDRVTARLGRRLVEVPVGFKWFVEGLLDGSIGFAGEESAGAAFLRFDGTVWTTDKDGIILDLLAAEMLAITDRDPGELYRDLTRELGDPVYERLDAPATPEQKAVLERLSPHQIHASELAGEQIMATLSEAPGNGSAIGGLKVITANGWFAARPSGTENVYKIYAESFRGTDHLRQIQDAAQALIAEVSAAKV
jgi:phosphoglucomutase